MRLKLYKNNYDREFLRSKCLEKDYTESKLVAHQLRQALLFDTIKGKNPVGLASNQMGLNSSVFVAKIDGQWKSFINTKIVEHSDKTVNYKEGCLSLNPNKEFKTKRYDWIKISYLNKKGKEVTEKYDKFNAIIIQHELDHLNGKLCKDGGINE